MPPWLTSRHTDQQTNSIFWCVDMNSWPSCLKSHWLAYVMKTWASLFWQVVLCGVLKEDEMKTEAEKKLKTRRPRKVIKKSHMEDSYPTYLQVCNALVWHLPQVCCEGVSNNIEQLRCLGFVLAHISPLAQHVNRKNLENPAPDFPKFSGFSGGDV